MEYILETGFGLASYLGRDILRGWQHQILDGLVQPICNLIYGSEKLLSNFFWPIGIRLQQEARISFDLSLRGVQCVSQIYHWLLISGYIICRRLLGTGNSRSSLL
jgi:hypothetical protein